MVSLLHLAAYGVAFVVTPGYSVHVRGPMGPEQAIRMRSTDSGTVLDAVAALKRRPDELQRTTMWIVRPAAGGVQVLPIDWVGITQRGETATNFIIFAGDRLFLQVRPDR